MNDTALGEQVRISREEIDNLRNRTHDHASILAAHGMQVEHCVEQIKLLREENSRDHAEVIERLERLDVRLEQKVDHARVNNHAARIDSLEQTRDKGRGVLMAALAFQSILLIAVAVLSVLAGVGNL
jgi:hypothetical protein